MKSFALIKINHLLCRVRSRYAYNEGLLQTLGNIMKLTLLASTLAAMLTFNVSLAHNHKEHADSAHTGESAKKHTQGKRHHHKGHHRDKIHHMMMSKADSNEDGKVDLNEYLENAQQRFESMDGDSDGFVTGEEMRAAGKAMRKKHKEAMKAARKSYHESVQDEK